jgi:hypothetical protein
MLMLKKWIFSTAFSFVASPLCGYLFFLYSEQIPGMGRIAAFIFAGFAVGAAQGAIFGHSLYKSIAAGAFLGLLLLWTPVVFVTYGFALLGLPLLMVFAGCIAVGARCSGRFFAS